MDAERTRPHDIAFYAGPTPGAPSDPDLEPRMMTCVIGDGSTVRYVGRGAAVGHWRIRNEAGEVLMQGAPSDLGQGMREDFAVLVYGWDYSVQSMQIYPPRGGMSAPMLADWLLPDGADVSREGRRVTILCGSHVEARELCERLGGRDEGVGY